MTFIPSEKFRILAPLCTRSDESSKDITTGINVEITMDEVVMVAASSSMVCVHRWPIQGRLERLMDIVVHRKDAEALASCPLQWGLKSPHLWHFDHLKDGTHIYDARSYGCVRPVSDMQGVLGTVYPPIWDHLPSASDSERVVSLRQLRKDINKHKLRVDEMMCLDSKTLVNPDKLKLAVDTIAKLSKGTRYIRLSFHGKDKAVRIAHEKEPGVVDQRTLVWLMPMRDD